MDKRERVRQAVTADKPGCRIKPCSPSEKNCACGRFADAAIAAYEAALAEEEPSEAEVEAAREIIRLSGLPYHKVTVRDALRAARKARMG